MKIGGDYNKFSGKEQLFINEIGAGGRDDLERWVSQKYSNISSPYGQVWLIEEARHVGGPAVNPEEYRRRMVDFFNDALAE